MSQIEFTCPRCGGHTFGNTLCHGWVERVDDVAPARTKPCDFTWSEADDYKYFTLDGKPFESAEAPVTAQAV